MRTPPRASRSSPDRTSCGSAGCIPTTSLLEPSISRITKLPWLLTSTLAQGDSQAGRRRAGRRGLSAKPHRVPLPVAEVGAAGHADVDAPPVDLHERDALFQGQNKPVQPFFGVAVEDHTLGVKGAQLEGRLDAAGNRKPVRMGLRRRTYVRLTPVDVAQVDGCLDQRPPDFPLLAQEHRRVSRHLFLKDKNAPRFEPPPRA